MNVYTSFESCVDPDSNNQVENRTKPGEEHRAKQMIRH